MNASDSLSTKRTFNDGNVRNGRATFTSALVLPKVPIESAARIQA